MGNSPQKPRVHFDNAEPVMKHNKQMNFRNILRRLKANSRNSLSNGTLVGVDWTGDSISAQQLQVACDQVTVAADFHRRWPQNASPAQSPETAGEWLASELNTAGITATQAAVCVPRRDVSLKLLEFPVVDDDELLSLVMLQGESLLEGTADDRTFDFLPLPVKEGDRHRYVLVATIAKSKLQQMQQVLAAAGLTMKTAGVGELTLGALSPEQIDGLTLSILANHAKVEFVINYQGVPAASYAAPMRGQGAAELARIIPHVQDRLIATLPKSLASEPLQKTYLLGPNAARLQRHLAADSDASKVQMITTQCNNAVRTLSLVERIIANEALINFLSPRRPADAVAVRRKQLGRYAAGVAVLCGLIGFWIHEQKSTLESQLSTMQQSEHNLQELNDRGRSVVQTWQYVDNWKSSATNWSNELHRFTEQLPETGKMYLTQLQLEQPANAQLPVIRADGLAKEPEVAMGLNRRLMSSGGRYELQPNGIEPSVQDTDFRSVFRVDAKILEKKRGE